MRSDGSVYEDEGTGDVLVVDDVRANRFVMERVLSKMGCRVTSAACGPDALRLAVESPPDLALVDVMLPDMDGYEVCRRLLAEPRTRFTPVIMVTALSEIEDIEKAFDAGAMDYICRPFNPRELVVRARNAIRLKRQEDRLRLFQVKLSRELELAGALQETMLSMPPLLTGTMRVSTAYRPSLNVSGDVFDRVLLPDGRMCLYVADVAGHGVAAAMVSSLLKATFTEVIHSAGANCSPALLCNEVEARFRRTIKDPSFYATLLLAICDPDTSRWRVMNCGHPSPILLARDGGCSRPCETGGNTPIGFGFLGSRPYKESDEVEVDTVLGDVLFFYTDGLTEARHRTRDDECGVERLSDVLASCYEGNACLSLGARVLETLSDQGYMIGQDDCSVVVAETVSLTGILFDGRVPAALHEIQSLGETVEAALRARGWCKASATSVRMVVVEHGNNIVIHGKLQSDETIHCHIQDMGEACSIAVRDPGPAWEYPRKIDVANVMPSSGEESGRGIPMIFRIAQNPLFYRERGSNVLVMSILKECGESILNGGSE
jgi:sigma-B regulation protein RsbU (phosphoserine phosphatase)